MSLTEVNDSLIWGAFHSTKITGCNFRNFRWSNQDGKRPGGETGSQNGQSALGLMCDAEKDWYERCFRASGAINGCQKFTLDKPEMEFPFFIMKPPVTSF